MSAAAPQLNDVSVVTKANVYFNGDVISYTLLLPANAKKTVGLIRPGSYHFNTGAPERMEIVDGSCQVTLDGGTEKLAYVAGSHFDVPGNSGFQIEVSSGLCHYICSFLD
jgi:purine/pyrimidine-nucleoside phosphorylase